MMRPAPRGLRRTALSLALMGASLATQAATPGVDEPPLPGTPRPLVVPQYQEATLPNGVRVVVAERHDLPLVTLALHLRLGAAAEPEGRAGLAALTAELRTKGATVQGRRLDATQMARRAEALGSSLMSAADWRGTSLSMTVATPNAGEAATLLAASLLQPSLAPAELERLKAQTADGLKLSLSDPMALAGLVARRAWWGSSVYGGAVTPASLERIQPADVQAFHRQQLRPELATLVVTGDVTLAQARALAERHLGAWKPNRMALPQARQEPAAPKVPATVLVNLPGAGQSGVVVMAPAVADDAPDRRAAQVAAAVLGGGYSARLNQEVRIKRGLSYGASAAQDLLPVGGVLRAATQTNNATAGTVVTLMREEILRLGREAPPAEELEARKATLVGGFGRQIETNGGLAQLAIDLIGRQRPLAEAQRHVPDIQAISAEAVRDFAARTWTAARLRTVVVGDLDAAAEGLKPVDAQPLVVPAAELDLEAATLQRGKP